jgi:hypothetical protein
MSGAIVILPPPGKTFSTLAEVLQPGEMSAFFVVEAGKLDWLEKQRKLIEIYLGNSVPVVLSFEDEAEAREAHRRWASVARRRRH